MVSRSLRRCVDCQCLPALAQDGASSPSAAFLTFIFCYNSNMKSLIETNPYLKDVATRKMLVKRSVTTSCGVEGIKVTSPSNIEIPRDRARKVYLDLLNRRRLF